ncbi:hypothetical protein rosmuc_03779 [Roseovarius mucosus DSM 17069]|uniref:Uncharacterized protein n=1 Tax=Roseovarius mucosus DSM 17069 TaxID=1288298 RepID=A0A0A0HES0_9RHOB|nr:hypothetical protein [Roseovarius mucosus]KGM86217.1 hypothetical protein rosmuc_03779 [Roseovarius mucosus DSM 17069]
MKDHKSTQKEAAETRIAEEAFQKRVEQGITGIKTIRKAAKPPLSDYLIIGEYLYFLSLAVPSTKLRKQRIKAENPEMLLLDSALRSNCKRLWEALEGMRDTDLLQALKIADINDYYTTHPVVIIRDYREAKKSA